MRYNSYQNGKIHIIVDSENKTMIAEVYEEPVAKLIVDALNGVSNHLVLERSVATTPTPTEIQVNAVQPEQITATVGEKTETEEPDYYKTGIKVIGGVNHYKCFYKCFNCSNQGKHYIPKEVRHIFCHECKFELPVMTATSSGFPNRDDFGNYFVSKHIASSGDQKLVKTWKTVDSKTSFLS